MLKYINYMAKLLTISFLVAVWLVYIGVTGFWWLLAITVPISFALFHWFGLYLVIIIEGGEKGEKDV